MNVGDAAPGAAHSALLPPLPLLSTAAVAGSDTYAAYSRHPSERDIAPVRNHGRIEVSDGGSVVLLGSPAENSGWIAADRGKIMMCGWRRASSADAINMSGLLRCRQGPAGEGDAGGIRLLSDRGGIRVSGVIDADGFEGIGGSLQIKGSRIDASAAIIGVSGNAGGGRIALRAEDSVTAGDLSVDDADAADATRGLPSIVANGVVMHADAGRAGTGGVISLSAPGAIVFSGVARASILASVGANMAAAAGGSDSGSASASANVNANANVGLSSSCGVPGAAGRVTISAGTRLDAQGEWDVSALEAGRQGSIHLAGWRVRIANDLDPPGMHAAEPVYDADEARLHADEIVRERVATGTISARAVSNSLQQGNVRIETHAHPVTRAADCLHIVSPITWRADTALSLISPTGVSVDAPVEGHGHASMLVLGNEKTRYDQGYIALRGAQSAVWMGATPYTLLRNRFDLQNILMYSDGQRYALLSPIDFGGDAITPIGAHFARLDGLGNTINRLRVDLGDLPSVGLFSVLHHGAALANMRIEAAEVTGLGDVGVMAGQASDGVQLSGIHINRAIVTSISGSAGGMVGVARNVAITASQVDARVSGHAGVGGGGPVYWRQGQA